MVDKMSLPPHGVCSFKMSARNLRMTHRGAVLMLGLFLLSMSAPGEPAIQSHFVGSESCRKCHAKEFNGWKQTRMANVVRDPKVHPEAVLGDFNDPDPIRSFDLDQVAFVYGSRWKQRYFA